MDKMVSVHEPFTFFMHSKVTITNKYKFILREPGGSPAYFYYIIVDDKEFAIWKPGTDLENN